MHKFTLRQLEYFRAVALHGSISAAAEIELVSRSSISAALDDLERAMGSTLAIRTKAQGVVLTANGHDVLRRVQAILRETSELAQLGNETELQGTLTIGCFPSLAPTVIPRLWQEFAQLHPNVTLDVVTAGRSELVRLTEQGMIDLAIAYNLHTFDQLETAALYDTVMHAILAAGHPLAAEGMVRAEDLAGEPLLLMDLSPSSEDILGYFSALGLTPKIGLRTSQFEFIRSLVARSIGYSMFIQRPKADTSYEGLPIQAVRILPEPPLERACIGWLSGQRPTRRAAAFVDLAVSRAEELKPLAL